MMWRATEYLAGATLSGMTKSGMASLSHSTSAADSISPGYVSGSDSSFSSPCGNTTRSTHLSLSASRPAGRVVENNHSNPDQTCPHDFETCLEGDCSNRRADSVHRTTTAVECECLGPTPPLPGAYCFTKACDFSSDAFTSPICTWPLSLASAVPTSIDRLTHAGLPSLVNATITQGLTLVHFSAQPEPI